MFIYKTSPRFSETDALGHINNTAVPVWFEDARRPLWRYFVPDEDPKHWCLVVARVVVDFKAEIFFGADIEIRTWVTHIGTSSFEVTQELWQKQQLCAKGVSVMVHFDFASRTSLPIPEALREKLTDHRPAPND